LLETLAEQLTDLAPTHIDILPLHLRRAVDWLKAHIEKPLSVADLVQVAGCSRRSLETGFQQFIGCSPARYILQQKLELAHHRLQHAQGSVSEVAYQCGFHHLSHFTRLYRGRYGETPSQTLKKRTLVTCR
jgi:transcriptional regulator GlxA family with amidase domain